MEKQEVDSIASRYGKDLCEDCKQKIVSEMQKIKAKGKLAATFAAMNISSKFAKLICHKCRVKLLTKMQRRGRV